MTTTITLRKLADGLQKSIDDSRRPMTQNPTPKRTREYQSRLIDADDLERGQQALHALADASENGTLPEVPSNLRTKKAILHLVRKGIDSSGGYYDAIPHKEYRDTSNEGVALQELLEGRKGSEQREADSERARKQELARKEDDLRYQKIPGFFPTPQPVIELMIAMADLSDSDTVLEPSAGKGDIADELRRSGIKTVSVIEPVLQLREILRSKGYGVIGSDFLEKEPREFYDKVLMNPPFEKGQDAEHVRHAYDMLLPGGRVVAVMSEGTFSRSDKKATEFRQWLESRDGFSEKLTPASFKGIDSFRQTGVAARLVFIDKPKNA